VSAIDRTKRLASELGTTQIDRLIVGEPMNLRYLSSYTGTNGLLLVSADTRVPHRFYTDFRYVTQAAQQVPAPIEREIAAGDLSRPRPKTSTSTVARKAGSASTTPP